MTSVPAWLSWWQDDIPCYFSRDRATDNAAYLTTLLGEDWIQKTLSESRYSNHPILRHWSNKGAGSFLLMNALAKDLKCVESVPGFSAVLDDLRSPKMGASAWHVVHSAALFSRANRSALVEFFDQDEETAPDFLLSVSGNLIPVEAKLLTTSDIEERFNSYADRLIAQLFSKAVPNNGIQPWLTVVIKDPHDLPSLDDVAEAVRSLLQRPPGLPSSLRTDRFNVFVEPHTTPAPNWSMHRHCCVLCPRSPKEIIRVEARHKKASKQLRSFGEGDRPGLFCLGLGGADDPRHFVQLLKQRFDRGFYRGVSAVMLIVTGTFLTRPRRCTFDRLALLHNTNATESLPTRIPIATAGELENLMSSSPEDDRVPAYRHALVEAHGDGTLPLVLPDVRLISLGMLA